MIASTPQPNWQPKRGGRDQLRLAPADCARSPAPRHCAYAMHLLNTITPAQRWGIARPDGSHPYGKKTLRGIAARLLSRP